MPQTFYITYILMALNIGLFFIAQNQPGLLNRMTFISHRVRVLKEYDRLFISGFAHAGLMHLAFNMLTLYFFGPFVEEVIGSTYFLILFLLSIVGGNLYCMYMRKEETGYAALGASGGVLGVIYAAIFLQPQLELNMLFLPIPISGWFFGILFSVISIWLTQLKRAEEARISHEGHLGGALTGAVFVIVINGNLSFSSEQLYFILGGVLPLIGFILVKLLAPGILYRHLR